MTAVDLVALLRARYAAPAWAFFDEFREATGGGVRALDGIAVGLYAGQGLEIHGFEVKVARSDLVRELADPSKAEAVARHCDRFYLVLADPDWAEDARLAVPEAWGILAPTVAAGVPALRLRRKAVRLMGISKGPVRGFIASLARRALADGGVPEAEVARRVYAATRKVEAKAAAERDVRTRDRLDAEAHEALRHRVADFERRSGLKIDAWGAGDVGDRVRRLGDLERLVREARGLHDSLAVALKPAPDKVLLP